MRTLPDPCAEPRTCSSVFQVPGSRFVCWVLFVAAGSRFHVLCSGRDAIVVLVARNPEP
jgi:hypothetical protein